jgi:hypothetical protein
VGGLRPNSPVTCGSSTSHPALSGRPRAVGAGTLRLPWDGRELAERPRPQPAAFRGCSVRAGSHLLCPPRRHAPAGVGWDRMPPSRPRSHRLTLALPLQAVRSPSASSLSGRACPPSSPSSPPMRCPGSGLQRSSRLSASKPLRPPWRSRVATGSPHPASGGKPAFAATATCWLVKCRDVAVSTRTKAPQGLESCRRGAAS